MVEGGEAAAEMGQFRTTALHGADKSFPTSTLRLKSTSGVGSDLRQALAPMGQGRLSEKVFTASCPDALARATLNGDATRAARLGLENAKNQQPGGDEQMFGAE
jgi:hypothetical protein